MKRRVRLRNSLVARDRVQIDLGGPLLREREGVKLTQRSLSSRLCEVIERLGRVVDVAMPDLPAPAWELICWTGWDAISHERIVSRNRPQDIDSLAWAALIGGVADWIAGHEPETAPPWAINLPARLAAMSMLERVAVLERVEAYGRAEAMR